MDSKKIAVVAVAVLALAGGGVFLATRDSGTKDAAKPASQSSSEASSEASQPTSDIVDLAVATPDLSTLVTAVKAAGLVDTLKGEGPFTVFAPTNDAFSKLPAGTLDSLLKPENVDQLKAILTYHVVPAAALSTDLSDGQELTTVQGAKLTVNIADGKVTLTDAKGNKSTVVKADIKAKNGVVHVIDSVVLPQ